MRCLVFIWAFLDLCLLAAGVLSIVASVVFMSPDHLILSMIFEKIDFKCESAAVQGCKLSDCSRDCPRRVVHPHMLALGPSIPAAKRQAGPAEGSQLHADRCISRYPSGE